MIGQQLGEALAHRARRAQDTDLDLLLMVCRRAADGLNAGITHCSISTSTRLRHRDNIRVHAGRGRIHPRAAALEDERRVGVVARVVGHQVVVAAELAQGGIQGHGLQPDGRPAVLKSAT